MSHINAYQASFLLLALSLITSTIAGTIDKNMMATMSNLRFC